MNFDIKPLAITLIVIEIHAVIEPSFIPLIDNRKHINRIPVTKVALIPPKYAADKIASCLKSKILFL